MAQGSIRKRGKHTWQIRISLWRNRAGKRRWYTETVHGKKGDAERRCAVLLVLHGRASRAQLSRIILGDYLKIWLNNSVEGTVARRTYADYQEIVRRYIDDDEIARMRLCDATPIHLQAFYKKLTANGVGARSVRYVHSVLSRAYRQAERWDMVPRNIVKLVDPPKLQRRNPPRALDFEQVKKFIDAAMADNYWALWILALDSGMRPEEYLGLKWPDIDMESRTLKIERALCLNRKGGGWYFGDLKTPESRRAIGITQATVDALERHRLEQDHLQCAVGKDWQNLDLVFTNQTGGPVQHSTLHRWHFKPTLKRAGLPDSFRIYDLRHTCATLLGVKGVRPKLIQSRLGHSSIMTTMDVYSHVLQSEQEIAPSVIEATIFSKIVIPVKEE